MSSTLEQLEAEILALPSDDRTCLQAKLDLSLSEEKKSGIDQVLSRRLDDECVPFPADWKDQVRARAAQKRAN